jgi:hypothetical protein
MPTPKAGYHLKSGEKVPGVTTIIGGQLAWSKPALLWWAWDQGRQGKDFRETKDEAADLGTRVHALIEMEMRGQRPTEIPADCESSLLAFYEWREAFKLQTSGSEVSLVSEKYRYGGTIDYPVLLNGRRCILDLKTSKGVYPDHRIQLAAYGQLWDEAHPDDPVTGYHLLQVGKENGSFGHYYWPSLAKEFEAFYLLRCLYDLQKEIGK